MSHRCLVGMILCLLTAAPLFAQQALLSSIAPVSIGLSLQGNVFTLDVQVAAATTLSVFCPVAPGLISFSGLTAPVEAAYDHKTRLLQLGLPPGHYRIAIRSM